MVCVLCTARVGRRFAEQEMYIVLAKVNANSSFLPRDALVHSAVLRLHVVRLSVCPSVTLVDQDHIGWKSWELIARSIRPTPSLFGKFGGD